MKKYLVLTIGIAMIVLSRCSGVAKSEGIKSEESLAVDKGIDLKSIKYDSFEVTAIGDSYLLKISFENKKSKYSIFASAVKQKDEFCLVKIGNDIIEM